MADIEDKSQVTTRFMPDWSVHPGTVIQEYMEHFEMTLDTLAYNLHRTRRFAKRLLRGKERVTLRLAGSLSDLFNRDATFWLQLQYNYDHWLERKRERDVDRIQWWPPLTITLISAAMIALAAYLSS